MGNSFKNIKSKAAMQNGLVLTLIILLISAFCVLFIFILSNTLFAANMQNDKNEANKIYEENTFIYNIEDTINKNKQSLRVEDYEIREKVIEYITLYEKTDTLPKDEIQVHKEGEVGIQEDIYLKKYENGVLKEQTLIAKNTKKAPTSKIVYIGTYVEPEPTPASPSSLYPSGASATPSGNPGEIYKDMPINKPSGLTLDQFKTMLSGMERDVNGVLEENAEYFYFVEQEYSVNGVLLAAMAIHESGWATSAISRDKKNLFGYGANDSNPYSDAYDFDEYRESIDLVARVLAKYYINEPGTDIYEGQAVGCYYNGPTLEGINVRYSTDDNWSNAVFKWMQYLYERI